MTQKRQTRRSEYEVVIDPKTTRTSVTPYETVTVVTAPDYRSATERLLTLIEEEAP